MRKKEWMMILGISALSFMLVGSLFAAEVTPIKVLKPYPEYWEYNLKAWYLAGTGLTRVKKPEIPVIAVMNKANVDQYKEMLAPSQYKLIKDWGLEVNITPPKFEYKPSKGYLEATEKTRAAGGAKITPEGYLANYFGGNPFPNPKTGAEVMWARKQRYWGDSVWAYFPGRVSDAKGRFRAVGGYTQKYRFSPRYDIPPIPSIEPNPDKIDFKEIDFIDYPPEISGSNMLLVRYLGMRGDDMWMYIPSARRTRRFSTAQRCDAYAGSHAKYDNFWIFNGKEGLFDFKLLGEKEMYVTSQQYITTPRRGDPAYGEWYDPRIPNKTGPTECYPDTLSPKSLKGTYKQIIGSFQNVIVSKRPCYIVEAKPKDPSYCFSKMVYYVDKEINELLMGEMYDKRGQLWILAWYPYEILPEVSPGKGGIANTCYCFYCDMLAEEGDLWEFDKEIKQNMVFKEDLFTEEGLRKWGH